MSDNLTMDPFWDSGSSDVRCSSVGADASRYHDPATVNFEGNELAGRSVGGLMPGSRGPRGVIIPRARREGGSRGFNPHKPRIINIDPDIKGGTSVIDLALIDKQTLEEAYHAAASVPEFADDPYLVAAQTYRNLAIGTEPVGMGRTSNQASSGRIAPLPGAYVVPESTRGGGQRLTPVDNVKMSAQPYPYLSPSVSPPDPTGDTPWNKNRNNRGIINNGLAESQYAEDEPVQELRPVPVRQQLQPVKQASARPQAVVPRGPLVNNSQPRPVAGPKTVAPSIGPPQKKVTFETRGWGQLPMYYHDVMVQNGLVVLVYDNRYAATPKYFPPKTEEGDLAMQIDGDINLYTVHSTDTRFIHDNKEYCLLVINSAFPPTEQLDSVPQE